MDAIARANDGLLALSVAVGLDVLRGMMEAKVAEIAGPKGKHNPNRQAVRHGSEKGSVVLGGRKAAIRRPRVRTMEGREVRLSSGSMITFKLNYTSEVIIDKNHQERGFWGLSQNRNTRNRFVYNPKFGV
jgi:hypothetical protein